MDDRKGERWAALGGAVFSVLIVISGLLPGTPPKTSDSAAKIAKFIGDKSDEIRISTYIGAIATIALFWWLGSVWRLMRRSEGGSPRWTVTALGGAIFAATMAAVGGIILGALPLIGVKTLGTEGVRIFYIVSTNVAIAPEIGAAIFVGAFSIVIIKSRALPVWLGYLGLVIAAVDVVGAAAVSTTNDSAFGVAFGGFLAFALWLLVASILMFVRAGQPEDGAVEMSAA